MLVSTPQADLALGVPSATKHNRPLSFDVLGDGVGRTWPGLDLPVTTWSSTQSLYACPLIERDSA